MATEFIDGGGQSVRTLKELLRPGLRAVIVGINPAPRSVELGHYWQGRHGRIMWGLLQEYGILKDLTPGREDDDAFVQGIGFADLIRTPTASAREISPRAKLAAIPDLVSRLATAGKVPVIFRYKEAADLVAPQLMRADHVVLQIPSPRGANSGGAEARARHMLAIKTAIGDPPGAAPRLCSKRKGRLAAASRESLVFSGNASAEHHAVSHEKQSAPCRYKRKGLGPG